MVGDEFLFACYKSQKSGQTSLPEPDKLVKIVKRNLLWFSKNKDGSEISFGESILPTAVFTGRHGEVGVGVGHQVVELCQLVDDDEWRTSGYWSWGRAWQIQKYLKT